MALKTTEIGTAGRLEDFFGRIDRHLKDSRKRESFAMYACGILGDGERKSAEPIAARSCADPEEVRNVHDKLLYFLGRSVWDDRAVRLEAARYAIEAIERREPITAWIVDDTGFLKQGRGDAPVGREPGPGARSGHWFRARLGDWARSVLGRLPEGAFDLVLAAWRICGRRSGSE